LWEAFPRSYEERHPPGIAEFYPNFRKVLIQEAIDPERIGSNPAKQGGSR
jgi:hypothetical protein